MSIANGRRPSRRHRQLLRERQELFTRLQDAERLLELQDSWVSSWGTGPYGISDYSGWTSGEPGGRLWIPIGTSGNSRDPRRRGNNGPFIETEEQLDDARMVARMLGQRNSIAIGVIETVKDFVVGEGMLPRAASKELDQKDQLITDAQDILDEFLEDNEYDELEQEYVGRAVIEGEYFERGHAEDGRLFVRVLEPEHIRQPVGLSDDWSWGIHNAPGDVTRILHYACNYGELGNDEPIDASEIVHAKLNVPRNVKRGLSDFFATQDQFEQVRRLLQCMSIGERIRSGIVGFWEYESASKSTLESHISTKRDTSQPLQTDPITGKQVNATRYDPGTIAHVPKGKKWVAMPPNAGVQGSTQVVQAVLRSLAVRWGFPENIISGDASNNNFASILVANAPLPKRYKRVQKFFKRRFLRTYWRALRVAWEAGRFGRGRTWEEIEFLIDVQLEGPSLELANDQVMATVNEIEHRNGILSKQTWRQRRGYDNELERKNLEEEPPTPAAAPGAPAGPMLPGGDLFPSMESEWMECGGEGGKPGPCPTGGGADKGGRKHNVALPKNPKRLKIDQADEALKQMGYKVGQRDYDLKSKTATVSVTTPDGTTKTLNSKEVSKLIYSGFDGDAKTVKQFPRGESYTGLGGAGPAPFFPSLGSPG